MSGIVAWHCSPRAGGLTDSLGRLFARGCAGAGAEAESLFLRDYKIRPCIGCNACLAPPHKCPLDANGDQAEFLFAKMLAAQLNVFLSPIYFYALPAGFKAFIDRGQRFWAMGENVSPPRNGGRALAILAAGRPRGEKLFAGSLLTLKYFLKSFAISLWEDNILLRGLNEPADLAQNPECAERLLKAGRECAASLKTT